MRNKDRSRVGLAAIRCRQLANGDGIIAAVHVKHIVLLMSFEGFKCAIVRALQWT